MGYLPVNFKAIGCVYKVYLISNSLQSAPYCGAYTVFFYMRLLACMALMMPFNMVGTMNL
jgi:hypothetical protein